jgi:hypothetical protein
MELELRFADGRLQGEGRDYVGWFVMHGRYETESGEVTIDKQYIDAHDVVYSGYNEGKGIWGTWAIPLLDRGGFHIWPRDMPDPTLWRLAAEVDAPVVVIPELTLDELVPAGLDLAEPVGW